LARGHVEKAAFNGYIDLCGGADYEFIAPDDNKHRGTEKTQRLVS